MNYRINHLHSPSVAETPPVGTHILDRVERSLMQLRLTREHRGKLREAPARIVLDGTSRAVYIVAGRKIQIQN